MMRTTSKITGLLVLILTALITMGLGNLGLFISVILGVFSLIVAEYFLHKVK